MLDEADGPMNFTQMVTLFASKMAGGTDDDETILKSFEVKDMFIIWKNGPALFWNVSRLSWISVTRFIDKPDCF